MTIDFEPHYTTAITAIQFMMENAGLDFHNTDIRVQFLESIHEDVILRSEYSRLSALGLQIGLLMEEELYHA